jgi:hypothetical protein
VRRLVSRLFNRRQRSAATRNVRHGSVPLVLVAGVLLLVAIPALAATPSVGGWAGTATLLGPPNQQVAIKFSTFRPTSGGRRVKTFRLDGRFKAIQCTGNEFSFATSGFKTTVKPKVINGAFNFKQTIDGKTLKGSGRFTARTRAKGTFTFTASKPGATCTTGKSNWTAKLQ